MKPNPEYLKNLAKAVLISQQCDLDWFLAGATYLHFSLVTAMLETMEEDRMEIDEGNKKQLSHMQYSLGRALGAIRRADREYISKVFLNQLMDGERVLNLSLDLNDESTIDAFLRGFKGEEE